MSLFTTRSQKGPPLQAPTSSWGPFRPLGVVLHALWALSLGLNQAPVIGLCVSRWIVC